MPGSVKTDWVQHIFVLVSCFYKTHCVFCLALSHFQKVYTVITFFFLVKKYPLKFYEHYTQSFCFRLKTVLYFLCFHQAHFTFIKHNIICAPAEHSELMFLLKTRPRSQSTRVCDSTQIQNKRLCTFQSPMKVSSCHFQL